MKKIPTLFQRHFEGHKVTDVLPTPTPGLEYVLDRLNDGSIWPTIKIDGACCAIRDGELYRRYDAKVGRKVPAGAIPCGEPDPVTGHWPHWIKVSTDRPEDKWFREARANSIDDLPDGTYEAVGPHFQGNPYELWDDSLVPHGTIKPKFVEPACFDLIKQYLASMAIEGFVFWNNEGPICKIKRSDFGFKWPVTQDEINAAYENYPNPDMIQIVKDEMSNYRKPIIRTVKELVDLVFPEGIDND